MADIFRSAFSYISSGIGGNSGENERGSELIGEIVDLGNLKLKVKKVIAEGEPYIYILYIHVYTLHMHTLYNTCIIILVIISDVYIIIILYTFV